MSLPGRYPTPAPSAAACCAVACCAQVLDKDFVLPIGKAKVMRPGKDITVTAFSKMVGFTLEAAADLEKEGIDVEVRGVQGVCGGGGAGGGC